MQIEIVTATRLTQEAFWARSALGQSLRRVAFDARIKVTAAFSNALGLPRLYNRRLLAPNAADVCVLVHDDVWLDDYFFAERIVEATSRFDVVGLAGNRQLPATHVAWCFLDEAFTWDAPDKLSGAIAHGNGPFGAISYFGPSGVPCELLDGVLLAVNTAALRQAGVGFDEQFDFHFYDLDLCRSARAKGLSVGTWPIAVTHQSGGAFGSPHWVAALDRYRAKWSPSAA